MSAQVKALCLAVSLLALVTFVVTGVGGRLDMVNAVALAAVALLGLIVGLGLKPRLADAESLRIAAPRVRAGTGARPRRPDPS